MSFIEVTFASSGNGSLGISKGNFNIGGGRSGPGAIGNHMYPQAMGGLTKPQDSPAAMGGVTEPQDSISLSEHTYRNSSGSEQQLPMADKFHEQMKNLQNQKFMHDFKTACSDFFHDIKEKLV